MRRSHTRIPARMRALALLVAVSFTAFACASEVRAPLEVVRPDLARAGRGVAKIVELELAPGSGRRAVGAAPAARPVHANPCGGSLPTPSGGGGGSSSGGGTDWGNGGDHGSGGGGFLEGMLLGLVVSLVFGLLTWGFVALWRVFFPKAPELPMAYEPGRVLALIRLDNAKSMRATADALAEAAGLEVEAVHALRATDDGLLVFRHPDPGADLGPVVAALAADDRVHLAQLDYWFETTARYDDPYAEMAWGPERIGAGRLQGSYDGSGVRVAILDTGVDASHADFRSRVVEEIDVTGAGISADLHGTALAGVIAAAPDDGFGTWGVAPGAELLAAKACQPLEDGGLAARCWSSTLARGLDFAIRREARVVNLSVAGPDEQLVTRMVNAALRHELLVVAAAGNGGKKSPPLYPGALPGVLTVTALDADDDLYAEATRGDQVDLAAPGVDIVSDAPDGSFPALSGTSFATAHVSGAAALLWSALPDLSRDEVKAALEISAEDLGDEESDPEFGSGRVDVCEALIEATASTTGPRCAAP